MLLVCIFCILPFTIANPVYPVARKSIDDNDVKYVYIPAVDFSSVAKQSQLNLLKSYKYEIVFVRGYDPTGVGSFDPNADVTIKNSNTVGDIVTEVYISPQPKGYKSASQQVDETYYGLINNGIDKQYITRLWIQVLDENCWNSEQDSRDFLQSAITRIAELGLKVGIYTSREDWHYITGEWTGASQLQLDLWYVNTTGNGVPGETPANFDGFIPFGGWTKPVVKQYGKTEILPNMNLLLNRDVVDFNGFL